MKWDKPVKNPNGATQSSLEPFGYDMIFARRVDGGGALTVSYKGNAFACYWTAPDATPEQSKATGEMMRNLCAQHSELHGLK